jgi:hypothetical protein
LHHQGQQGRGAGGPACSPHTSHVSLTAAMSRQ